MNPRRIMYLGVAALGIGVLALFAYQTQYSTSRSSETPALGNASAPAAPAAASGGAGGTAPAVDVAVVQQVKLVEDIHSVGTLHSNESVMIRPEVPGRISRLNFRDGQQVKKGQLLVAFDASVNQAEVQQARAELGIARANLVRNEDLARQNFISVRAKDESAANVQVLEARLALAEAHLAKLQIIAPFSGVVGMRNVSVGDYVKDGTDLVNLEDISSVKVDFRIPEKYTDQVRPGQQIEVTVDALPNTPFRARVDAIDPQVDSSGRSAQLRGRIENPEGRLKPGMFARVRLILSQRDDALVVPEEAIVPDGARTVVWKVVDNKAVRTEVRTGQRRAARVEIMDGIKAGDIVVIAGQMRLTRDGMPVRIVSGLPEGAAFDPAMAAVASQARAAKN